MATAESIKERFGTRLKIDLENDRSAWMLFLSNCFVIVLAVVQQWYIGELLWVYWLQNIIIGFFNWRRISNLKEFSTKGFKINGKPALPTKKTKKSTARFFLIHYSIFHLAYLVFLLFVTPALEQRFLLHGAIGLAIFLFNHTFSYHYNKERDAAGCPDIGNMMFFPYLRIIPMHLIIFIGAYFGGDSMITLFFFLMLKTAVDLLMHILGHRLMQSSPKEDIVHAPAQ